MEDFWRTPRKTKTGLGIIVFLIVLLVISNFWSANRVEKEINQLQTQLNTSQTKINQLQTQLNTSQTKINQL
ncbi:MAG: hypothetical protein ACOC6H_05055, partial [Thermoproteota archaeon]